MNTETESETSREHFKFDMPKVSPVRGERKITITYDKFNYRYVIKRSVLKHFFGIPYWRHERVEYGRPRDIAHYTVAWQNEFNISDTQVFDFTE